MSWEIRQGDAFEQLQLIPDESVHCCVTSPPYWGLRDYGVKGQIGLEETPEEYVANIEIIFSEVRRCLRPDGTLWLNLGDCYSSGGHGGGGSFMKMRGGEGSAGEGAWSHRRFQKGWRKPPDGLKLEKFWKVARVAPVWNTAKGNAGPLPSKHFTRGRR